MRTALDKMDSERFFVYEFALVFRKVQLQFFRCIGRRIYPILLWVILVDKAAYLFLIVLRNLRGSAAPWFITNVLVENPFVYPIVNG